MKKAKHALTVRDMAVFSMLAALMFGSKVIMDALPNIHLLGMFIMVYTRVYRTKALIPIYLFIFMTGLYGGFGLWWIPYLYIWAILWGVTMLLPRRMPKWLCTIVYPAVCCLFGLLYGVLYAPAQALLFGLDFKGMLAWIAAGLPFDLMHGIGNLFAGLLILPLSELLLKLERKHHPIQGEKKMNDYRKLELQRKANHKKEEYKYFIGTTEKNPLEYRVGERIVFKIRAKHEDAFLSVPYLRFFLTCDDGQVYDGFAEPAEDGWFYIETTLKKSGFAYLKAKACDEEKRPIGEIDEFNGSACANAEEILRASKIPEDYAAFRESLCKAVEDCEPRVLYSQRIESERFPDFETYNMRIAAPGSEYVSVCVSYPKGAQNGSLALAMFFQGYGVCSADPMPRAGYLSVHVNAHCIRNGESHEYYDALREGALKGYGFQAEENKSTSTSYWTKMILRDLQALHFFREHALLNQRDYFFVGSSQGGMQACNVAALFDRATAVIMNVPGFADIYGDVAEGKRKSSMPKGDGIGYFDTALAAEFLKCPAFIISGLGDSTCFPSTQLALFNAIHTPKYIEFYQNKIHSFTIPWDNCVYTMGDAALAERHMDLRAMYYDWN